MKKQEELLDPAFSDPVSARIARVLARRVAEREPLHNRDNCIKRFGDMVGEESNKIHNAPVNEFIDRDTEELYARRERSRHYIPLNNYELEEGFAS